MGHPPSPQQPRNEIGNTEDGQDSHPDISGVARTHSPDPELRDYGFCCAFCKCHPNKQSSLVTSPGIGAAHHRHCCHDLEDNKHAPSDWKSPIDLVLEEIGLGESDNNNNDDNPTETMTLTMLQEKVRTAKRLETQNQADFQDAGE